MSLTLRCRLPFRRKSEHLRHHIGFTHLKRFGVREKKRPQVATATHDKVVQFTKPQVSIHATKSQLTHAVRVINFYHHNY